MKVRSVWLMTSLLVALQAGAAGVAQADSSSSTGTSPQSSKAEDPEFGALAPTWPLRSSIRLPGIRFHQRVFQFFADLNDGTRVASTRGYDLSVDYVVRRLRYARPFDGLNAYFDVEVQEFEFPFFEEFSDPTLEQVGSTAYAPNEDFFTMSFSPPGDVSGETIRPDDDGCDPADFGNTDYTGAIAVILRGGCTFALKATNAEDAGAAGAVVFNDETRSDPFRGTLGGIVVDIPVVGTSYAIGLELTAGDITARIATDTFVETRTTSNVIAETKTGNPDKVIVVGAHLDSVAEGPGVQDNGSGSAGILEVALRMAKLNIEPTNKVRFAWWGAEEAGLLGSNYYVNNLSDDELGQIALNLNFDMIGSPNYVYFVYDGDGSAGLPGGAGPAGSDLIEKVFVDYYDRKGETSAPTDFSGRSDYRAFILQGIPAGGLFTGAEGIKTDEEVEIWGGTAGEQYDPCYHLACDTLDNIALDALWFNTRAVAHATLTFAMADEPIPPTPATATLRTTSVEDAAERFAYQGDLLVR